MRHPEPMTQTMTISEAKSALSRLVDAVYRKETRVLVEKSGTPVAALVSVDDLDRLQRIERDWESTTRALERISEAFADVPGDELEAKIEEIIAEKRAREERFAVIDRMRAAFADVSPEEVEREAERTVAESRERIRRQLMEPVTR